MLALAGLSVGDAFGERFFGVPHEVIERIMHRDVPVAPWYYTDDTEMALSVVECLQEHDGIDPDVLALGFARRFDPRRGYGLGARILLQSVKDGASWLTEAQGMFGGKGSFGNGAAMRVAPVGAYFADDMDAVVHHARLSALPTHTHAEGIAGAIAVAVAAAVAWQMGEGEFCTPQSFMEQIYEHLPDSVVRDGIAEAIGLPEKCTAPDAAFALGAGQSVSAQDTVPFTIWCAAHFLDSYEEAMWNTVSGLGDRDTTCAIVGGIVALVDREGIPEQWLEAREALPIGLESEGVREGRQYDA